MSVTQTTGIKEEVSIRAYLTIYPLIVPLADALLKSEQTEPLAKTIRAITRMVWHTFSSVTILALNGHGHDCLRLTRSMLEGAVTATYLAKYPGELADYLNYARISAKRLLDFEIRHPPEKGPLHSKEQIERVNQEYESVVAQFTGASGKVRDHWCRKQIRQMFMEVGLEDWYLTVYHLGSACVHMNARGMIMSYHLDDALEPINYVPPDDDWIIISLSASRVSLMYVVEALKNASSNRSQDECIERIIGLLTLPTE